MPDLSRFAVFATRHVPHVPQTFSTWGTPVQIEKNKQYQRHSLTVPLVPHVPHENDMGWNEEDWRVAFDERAAILEYDAGLSRAEAERQARRDIEVMRSQRDRAK